MPERVEDVGGTYRLGQCEECDEDVMENEEYVLDYNPGRGHGFVNAFVPVHLRCKDD